MIINDDILLRLTKIELFSDFYPVDNEDNSRILKGLANVLSVENYKAGEEIIKEGNEGDTLYILYEGHVQVLRNTLSNEPFAVVNLSAEQNVFFGEIALIDKDTRSASVKAVSDCKVLGLTGKDFLSLCEKEQKFGFKVMFRIAVRLAQSLRRSTSDALTLYQALVEEVSGS